MHLIRPGLVLALALGLVACRESPPPTVALPSVPQLTPGALPPASPSPLPSLLPPIDLPSVEVPPVGPAGSGRLLVAMSSPQAGGAEATDVSCVESGGTLTVTVAQTDLGDGITLGFTLTIGGYSGPGAYADASVSFTITSPESGARQVAADGVGVVVTEEGRSGGFGVAPPDSDGFSGSFQWTCSA